MALNNLLVQLGLNTSNYDAGLNKAKGLAASFAGSLKAQLAAAFSIGAITNYTQSVFNAMDRIKDLSDQFNITTDDLQRFDFHAKRNGLTMEAFGAGLSKIANLRRDAAKGDKEAVATLNEFGISLAQATDPAFTMADAIDAVGKSINTFGLNTQRTAMLTDLFGKSGQRLISTLKEISQAPKVSTVSEKDLKTIEELKNKWSDFWTEARANSAAIIAQLGRGEIGEFITDPGGKVKKRGPTQPIIGGGIFSMMRTVPPSTGFQAPAFIGDRNLENLGTQKTDQQLARLIRIAEEQKRTLEKIAEKGAIGQATYF